MNTIMRNLASVLVSMVASVVTAQTMSSFSLEPAKITAEETQALERVINSSAPEALHLRPAEADLFLQLLHNGNRMVSFGVAENGAFGLCEDTNIDAYLVRENNGFAILYEIESEDGDRARSASAKVAIRPPHAELTANEVKLLQERLASAVFASEIDSIAFTSLLKNGNKDNFSIGFADNDCLGSLPVRYGDYTEAYIIRTNGGVNLYYEVYDGEKEELKAVRQTAAIGLK